MKRLIVALVVVLTVSAMFSMAYIGYRMGVEQAQSKIPTSTEQIEMGTNTEVVVTRNQTQPSGEG